MSKSKIDSVQLDYIEGQDIIARVFYGRLLKLRELAAENPGELRFYFDRAELRLLPKRYDLYRSGDLKLRIPRLEEVVEDLRARGHLWLTHEGAGIVAIDPFGNRLQISEAPTSSPYLEGWAA